MRRDPVTSDVRDEVFRRDAAFTGWAGVGSICVAPFLDRLAGRCDGRTTLDHVPDANRKGMGMRREIAAPSNPAHLASICARHHLETGWATSHRPLLREYLGRTR